MGGPQLGQFQAGVLAALISMRGSIWVKDFMLGAGMPDGLRFPWAKAGVALRRSAKLIRLTRDNEKCMAGG